MAMNPLTMKVVELREELAKRDLETGGKKNALLKRLNAALVAELPEEEEEEEMDTTEDKVEETTEAPAAEKTEPSSTSEVSETTSEKTDAAVEGNTSDKVESSEKMETEKDAGDASPEKPDAEKETPSEESSPPTKKAKTEPIDVTPDIPPEEVNKPADLGAHFLKVEGCSDDITADDIREAFGEFGTILHVYAVPRPKKQKKETEAPSASADEDAEMTDTAKPNGSAEPKEDSDGAKDAEMQESTGDSSETATEADPKEAEPKEAEPKEAEPKEAEPKEAEPKEAEPKEAEPKEAEPKDKAEKKEKDTEETETEKKEEPEETIVPHFLVAYDKSESRDKAVANFKGDIKDQTVTLTVEYLAEEKTTLLIGNLPDGIDGAQMKIEIEKLAPDGLVDFVAKEGKKGYCYASYSSIKQAVTAHKLLRAGKIDDRIPNPEYHTPEGSDEKKHLCTLFVRGIGPGITDDNLKSLYDPFGIIRKVTIPRDNQNRPSGFGFVEFIREADCSVAAEELPHSTIDSMTLAAAVSKPQKKGYDGQGRKNYRGGQRGRNRGYQRRGGYSGYSYGGGYGYPHRGGYGGGYPPYGGYGGYSYGPSYGGYGYGQPRRGSQRYGGTVMALDTRTNRMVPLNYDQVRRQRPGYGGGGYGGGYYGARRYRPY